MIERRIIAQNITNLTDARYFAALGVDYISFNTLPDSLYAMSLEQILEIKDWVEGPKCLIEANALEFDEIADGLILKTVYSSLPLSKESFFRIDFNELKKGLPDGRYILKINNFQELEKIHNYKSKDLIGLQLYLDISDVTLKDINLIGDHGIVVQGGDEEAPGIKSFDELDELFELLSSFD